MGVEEKQMKAKNVGTINLSDKIIISDPGDDREYSGINKDIPMKSGEYQAVIVQRDEGEYGMCITALAVIHTDSIYEITSKTPNWELWSSTLVDSGMCGIFDDSIYPKSKYEGGTVGNPDSFYGECVNIKLAEPQYGILKNKSGVVSISGYGEGNFDLYCISSDHKNIAFIIDYDVANKWQIRDLIINSLKK